jgi:hypothetical protein
MNLIIANVTKIIHIREIVFPESNQIWTMITVAYEDVNGWGITDLMYKKENTPIVTVGYEFLH